MRQLLTSALLLTLLLSSNISASPRATGVKRDRFSQTKPSAPSHRFKIRTITAGVNLKNTSDLATVESAIAFLQKARKEFEAAGYEIQTLRIATQPLPEYLNGKTRPQALADLKKIDELVSAGNVILSIG